MEAKNCFFGLMLIYFSLFFSFNSFGQLTVDAGKDTTYCTGLYSHTMHLGDHAIIKNGVEPYSIKWECKVELTKHLIFTAKDFLNDTTLLSPLFIDHLGGSEWIKFIIHVRDSKNNYARDSLKVRFSNFAFLTGYLVVELVKGDSILFNQSSVVGGIAPLKFHWQPTIGLSNPNTLVTWCKTDLLTEYITQYNIVAIDSCGCVSDPNLAYEVRIIPTGLEPTIKDQKLTAYPNPTAGKIKLIFNQVPEMGSYVMVNNVTGKTILKQPIHNIEEWIDLQGNTPGVYFIKTNLKDVKVQKVMLK